MEEDFWAEINLYKDGQENLNAKNIIYEQEIKKL